MTHALITALGRLRQKEYMFKASPRCTMRTYLKKKKQQKALRVISIKKIQMENLTLVVNKETQRELSKYYFANKINKDFFNFNLFF